MKQVIFRVPQDVEQFLAQQKNVNAFLNELIKREMEHSESAQASIADMRKQMEKIQADVEAMRSAIPKMPQIMTPEQQGIMKPLKSAFGKE